MEYEDKGNTEWSLVANPESLKERSGRESVRWGRGTLHLERTKNLRQFYLIKLSHIPRIEICIAVFIFTTELITV